MLTHRIANVNEYNCIMPNFGIRNLLINSLPNGITGTKY